MKRRNFLKLIGAAFLSPTALVIGKDPIANFGTQSLAPGTPGATGRNGPAEPKVEPPENWQRGYKGSSEMESGYFYAPYLPTYRTPVVLDPNSFSPRKGIITRYNKKLLEEGSRFYSRITIKDFVI
jgi:hypothetical protein